MPENKMEKITTEMAEFICDKICKNPINTQNEEQLEDICLECKLSQYMCDIENTFNSKELEDVYEYTTKYDNGDITAGLIQTNNPDVAYNTIANMQHDATKCSSVKINPIQFDSNGIFKVMTKRAVTIEDVAAVATKIFKESCIEVAKKNWAESQVEMLDRVFNCVLMGCEYKCVGGGYNQQIPDHPEHPYDCFFELDREVADERMPCEDE